MFFINQSFGGANPPSIGVVSALALFQKIGRGLGAVLAILLAIAAYIPGASAATPSSIGCKDGAPSCQLPSGHSTYNFELADFNWTAQVILPKAPREGNIVTVINKAETTTKVSAAGISLDGIPLQQNQQLTFTYQQSRWNASYLHVSNLPGSHRSPFYLPSFQGGSIYLDLSYNSPGGVVLPDNRRAGSFYSFGMNSNATNSVVVQGALAGSGNVTISASRTGATFYANGWEWALYPSGTPIYSPAALGCHKNGPGFYDPCLLPSGHQFYTFEVSDNSWNQDILLPTKPKLGDSVIVLNSSSTAEKFTTVGAAPGTGLTLWYGRATNFTYKQVLGKRVWVADLYNNCSNAGKPCTLPSFDNGMVQTEISSAGANRFDLPKAPMPDSFYELSAKTPVWVDTGSGTIQIPQGKTHLFYVVDKKWVHKTKLEITSEDLGCQSGAPCSLPNGFDEINMALSDSNIIRHVQLPSNASEGDSVLIDNQQSVSVQVSVTGMDGVQVNSGNSQTFVFQKTPLGVVQWTTSGHLDQICPVATPCSLPTFSNGYLQYSGTSAITTKVRLPSIYDMTPTGIELFMASDATNQISVENGGGLFTLSAAENPQLVFTSDYTGWSPVLKNSPSQLNCNNSNVCVLPNGKSNYVFELSNRDRVPQIKLPVNPVMEQEVLIKNHSTEPTYVSVTGTSGDGLAVAGGSQLRFTYRQSDAKKIQWVADKVRVTHCSMNTAITCELHSFNKGYAHVDLTGVFNSGFSLPRTPQADSVYVISNNNDDGWQTSITGAGTMVLRAKELRQFYVKDGVWNYDRAQNGFDPAYHEVKELVVHHDVVNSSAAEVYANGNMRAPVYVMVKVVDTFTQKPVDIYNTPGLVKFYDHSVGTGTNRNAWIIPDENPVGDNYMVGWQAFTKPNDFDTIVSYSAQNTVVTAESQIAAMSRSGEIDEYSRFNLYVSTTKSALKHLCVRFGTSTKYRDSCADGPNTTNKATIRGILPVIRNGSDFNITRSRLDTQDHAVGWSLMFVPNGQNGRFRIHSVISKPIFSLYFNKHGYIDTHSNAWEWNNSDWGVIDMRQASNGINGNKGSGSRALYMARFGATKLGWGGHTEKANGNDRSYIKFSAEPLTQDGYLYLGAMQGGECAERDQRSVYAGHFHVGSLDSKGAIEFLDNYGNPGMISYRPDAENCGIYTFN